MKLLKNAIVASAAVGAMALASSAHAVAMYSDLGNWKAAVGTWSETTHLGDEYSTISGFTTTDGVSVGLSGSGSVRQIGSSWATWCCGYGSQVEWTTGPTSQTWTLGLNHG